MREGQYASIIAPRHTTPGTVVLGRNSTCGGQAVRASPKSRGHGASRAWGAQESVHTARPSMSRSLSSTAARPAGTHPVNALPSSLQRTRFSRPPSSPGIVPVSRFLLSHRFVRDARSPSSAGMLPVSRLPCRYSRSRLDRCPGQPGSSRSTRCRTETATQGRKCAQALTAPGQSGRCDGAEGGSGGTCRPAAPVSHPSAHSREHTAS